MSLVHARYPGLPTGPGEEMQFDITCLDSLALRQLMDLTQACISAAKVSCCRFHLSVGLSLYSVGLHAVSQKAMETCWQLQCKPADRQQPSLFPQCAYLACVFQQMLLGNLS